jgi:chorismate-pyruvate lyase
MPEQTSGELLSLLLPLHFFYAKTGEILPLVELVNGDEIPDPHRSLLVHESDMTSTLKRFHGSDLDLNVLRAESSDGYLIRMVVLERMDNGRPVEFGAIGIRLEKLQEPLRDAVIAQETPFGGLLEKFRVDYRSKPKGYFQLSADRRIADALGEKANTRLYGRCNELTDPDGFAFADIVEILPSSSLIEQSNSENQAYL